MLDLVQWSCGCIGTKPVDGKTCIVSDCRGDEDPYFLGEPKEHKPSGRPERWMEEGFNAEGYRPLSPERNLAILNDLNRLIRDGYRFRELQCILKGMMK